GCEAAFARAAKLAAPQRYRTPCAAAEAAQPLAAAGERNAYGRKVNKTAYRYHSGDSARDYSAQSHHSEAGPACRQACPHSYRTEFFAFVKRYFLRAIGASPARLPGRRRRHDGRRAVVRD